MQVSNPEHLGSRINDHIPETYYREKKIVEMATGPNGFNVLTPEYIAYVCEKNGQFSVPTLNTAMYLHYKGFKKIEALEQYTQLRALWLEVNGIETISGLDHLVELKMLYLHQNAISKMENLSNLKNLVALNLSHNHIKVIEGLEGLDNLKNLDLSHNYISEMSNCSQVKQLPALASLDISHNQIDQKDEILPFFTEMQELRCLYLKGNPVIRLISQYRKNMVANMKLLYYLDDRPVTEVERLADDAWLRGGMEEENRVRDEYWGKKNATMKAITNRGSQLAEDGKKRRKENFKKMVSDLKGEKQALIDKHAVLKKTFKELPEEHQDRNYHLGKMRKVEEELQADWFRQFKMKGEPIPEEYGKPSNILRKEWEYAELAKKRREEEFKAREQELTVERRREIREREVRNAQANEHRFREAGSAGSVIPAAINTEQASTHAIQFHPAAGAANDGGSGGSSSGGAVSGTDSESDAELAKRTDITVKDMSHVKWSPKLEAQLEEILTRNHFDFRPTSKEFQRLLSKSQVTDGEKAVFKIDAKTLQLKWTDIEIRKYVIPGMNEESNAGSAVTNYDGTNSFGQPIKRDDDDDLPPLEEDPDFANRIQGTSEDTSASTSITEVTQTAKATAATNSDSNSEDEAKGTHYYNDLEELD